MYIPSITERIVHNEVETQPVRARASKRPVLRVTTEPDDVPDTRYPSPSQLIFVERCQLIFGETVD